MVGSSFEPSVSFLSSLDPPAAVSSPPPVFGLPLVDPITTISHAGQCRYFHEGLPGMVPPSDLVDARLGANNGISRFINNSTQARFKAGGVIDNVVFRSAGTFAVL